MNVSDLLNSLNNKQREGVEAKRGNLLVLAGAGSGKTRVLVYRIAWLLLIKQFSSSSIMAVTFTNKAAIEMRTRIENLIGTDYNKMWIGTFHGLAHRFLRTHYENANLPQDFQILDNEDQLRFIKNLIRTLNIDEKKWPPRQVMRYISSKKNEGLRPKDIIINNNSSESILLRIYQSYQDACDRSGLVDFSELLIRTYELWMHNPYILRQYQEQFSNILVDEFQDTNKIQYSWIQMLSSYHNNVMIVGDDDQSIYGWRGAKVENIQRFLNDFSNVRTIRLEQNYRSSNNILKAANSLIANNGNRLGKSLWTNSIEGEPISIYCAKNELDEARFVVDCIKSSQENGETLSNFAILYRSNAQSRVLEEALLYRKLQYHIYGGMRFFDRQEIKDTLAYLRLLFNRDDDVAYERIVNTPPRGIGNRTLNTIRHFASEKRLTLWIASNMILKERILAARESLALQCFINLIDTISKNTKQLSLHIQTDQVIQKSGLRAMYEQYKDEKSQARLENLEELVSATREYSIDKNQNMLPLQAFLSHVVLESGENYDDDSKNSVQLMTIHSSKGLEFRKVFIIGMEEGMFPVARSFGESHLLEEERRLAYVGITRAIELLTVTYAETRRLYGKEVVHRPSRFLNELPKKCVKRILRSNSVCIKSYQNVNVYVKSDSKFKVGQHVNHIKFGNGIVVKILGNGEDSRLKIFFKNQGTKWFMASHTNLKIIKI